LWGLASRVCPNVCCSPSSSLALKRPTGRRKVRRPHRRVCARSLWVSQPRTTKAHQPPHHFAQRPRIMATVRRSGRERRAKIWSDSEEEAAEQEHHHQPEAEEDGAEASVDEGATKRRRRRVYSTTEAFICLPCRKLKVSSSGLFVVAGSLERTLVVEASLLATRSGARARIGRSLRRVRPRRPFSTIPTMDGGRADPYDVVAAPVTPLEAPGLVVGVGPKLWDCLMWATSSISTDTHQLTHPPPHHHHHTTTSTAPVRPPVPLLPLFPTGTGMPPARPPPAGRAAAGGGGGVGGGGPTDAGGACREGEEPAAVCGGVHGSLPRAAAGRPRLPGAHAAHAVSPQ
jgi:hypothetical protein